VRIPVLLLAVAVTVAAANEIDTREAVLDGLLGGAPRTTGAPSSFEDEPIAPLSWSLEAARPLLDEVAALDTARGERAFARAAEKEAALGHEDVALALLAHAGEAGRPLLERLRAPRLEVEGESVRASNAAALARPFDLEDALDDLALAFRTGEGPADLAAAAVGHAHGEPAPLASLSASALLVETRPAGARAVLLRGGIAVHVERAERGLLVAAWDARTGAPVAGNALVILAADELRDGKPRRFSQAAALPLDDEGLTIAPADERFTRALVVVKGDDGRAGHAILALERAPQDQRAHVLVRWERTLVRPGEVARALLVVRRRLGQDLVPLRPGERCEAVLVDAAGKELARKELVVDRLGGAVFEAPAVRGVLRIEARVDGEPARIEGSPLLVAEPRQATVEFGIKAPGFVDAGKPFAVRFEAHDTLGAPLVGRIRWRLEAETTTEGAVATDVSGNATLSLRAAKDARLSAFFSDVTGREAAAGARISARGGEPWFELTSERRFLLPGEDADVQIDVFHTDGRPRTEEGTAVAFLERENGEVVVRADLKMKERGRAVFKLPGPGEWDVALVATPSHAALRFVAGEVPTPHLEVLPEKPVFQRGETARFLVRAPKGTRAFVVARSGGRSRATRFMGPGVHSIVLDPSWAPGFEVEAFAVIGGHLERATAHAEVALLGVALAIDLAPDKPSYKPEEKPIVRIHVRHEDNLPARGAQVHLALEDDDSARAAERAATSEEDLVLARRHGVASPAAPFVSLTTDDNGNTQAQLALPGAGRFRVRATAIALDGKVATREAQLAARRRLSIDLGAPPAMEVGDEVELVLAAWNDSGRPATVELSLASAAPSVLELEGDTKKKVEVPGRSGEVLRVRARAKAPGHAKIDAKLSLQNEDEAASATVAVTGPRLGWLAATSMVVGSETIAAAHSVAHLLAPEGPRLLVRADDPAATLGDLVAELVRPGHGLDLAEAFVPALLARRAFDARGEKWDDVAKRFGVDPNQVLLAGDPGKGPRDPRRSPLFAKARLDALVKEGLEALARRATPAGWSWRPGGPADLGSTAHALETLAVARELGVAVAPELLERGAVALDGLLAQGGPPALRAHAALVLVLLGKPAPLDKLEAEPRDPRADLLLVLARLHSAKGPDLDRARERARGLLAATPPEDARMAARELEIATLLEPTGPLARSLADEVVARRPVLAIAEPPLGSDVARALAEHVRLAPPRPLSGAVKIEGVGELPLDADDLLLTRAALLRDEAAPVGTLVLARTAPGEVRVTAGALALEPSGAGSVVVAKAWQRLERTLRAERGMERLEGRWVPLAEAARGELVRLELTVTSPRPVERFVLEERIPAGLELFRADGPNAQVLEGSVRFHADLLAAGEHHLALVFRARLAGDFKAPPTRSWSDPRPGGAVRTEVSRVKVVDTR
jgi:hypothetical protein